jgi:Ser-tRNA(Ala) deacylase AlaX
MENTVKNFGKSKKRNNMNPTTLLYMENSEQLQCTSNIIDIKKEDNKDVIILDQTIFYPQGGGQPYDTGLIKSESATFIVEEVRFVEGIVKHIGHFEAGAFQNGETVTCLVDAQKRTLHSTLHSAGHLIDLAVEKLGYNWIPTKGYHFPQGPNVEYEGEIPLEEKESVKKAIEDMCNELIKQNIEIKTLFVSKEELSKLCKDVPDYIPKDKPTRIVSFENLHTPCGGTHIKNLSQIKKMVIRKLKAKKGIIKVSYEVE